MRLQMQKKRELHTEVRARMIRGFKRDQRQKSIGGSK
jgi:hypothetical protein